MSVFKCKMCGGTLEVRENESVCVCDFCGTQQTIATTQDEALQGLFNRANILRMKSEFDKAESLYEKIIQTKPDEAEAYWGLILCRYGIEYVEDPKTFKRIPTCHRTSFDSVIADADYKAALKYADMAQRAIYEAEAKEIDRLQKEILALSQKEDPYDVFICYKETDESGRRTPDSVIANDIYHQLTQEGFKVFYAAISLENKLGSAYEPCIFAALNSAKVMLAVGTKPEYFNAVWVKNEWSRYLKLMKTDRSRILIPCYRDMDAYELPEEFAHLQAQDMSKIGFINDLVRGIKKVVKTDEPKAAAKETVGVSPVSANAAPLLKRAFMFLEDGDWAKADDFCEQVLNLDPENAQAYLGKFLVSVKHASFQGFLSERSDRAYIDHKYNKPQKAAFKPKEDALKQMAAQYAVPGYLEEETLLQELSRFDPTFASEFDQMERHISSCHMRMDANKDLQRARQYGNSEISRQIDALFETLNSMLVQAKQADENTVAEKRKAYEQFVQDFRVKAAQRSAEAKKQADADAAKKARILAKARAAKERDLNEKYQAAAALAAKADSVDTYNEAIEAFVKIRTYRDSDERINTLVERRDRVEVQIKKERARKAKKITLISIASIVAVAVLAVLTVNVFIPMTKYNAAKNLYKNGQFDEAIVAFEAMDGYKDSAEMIEQCKQGETDLAYEKAKALLSDKKYEEAKTAFNALNGYKDSKELIKECDEGIRADKYVEAKKLYEAGNYEKASSAFGALGDYKDNPLCNTSQGNHTKDKVFLLSIRETRLYFERMEEGTGKCVPTAFAKAQGANASVGHATGGQSTCNWWLRSIGGDSSHASFFEADGETVSCGGDFVNADGGAVRPAMWIDLDDK